MSAATNLSNLSGRRFPVLLGDQRSIWRGVPDSIPWEAISAHEPQARANHGQSLDALAQRGGLSPYELLAVLFDQCARRRSGQPCSAGSRRSGRPRSPTSC